MTTLSDYRTQVRTFLLTDATAVDHWDNTRIDQIINTARRWVEGEIVDAGTSLLDVEVELTATQDGDGNWTLALPSDFIRVKRLVKGDINSPGTWQTVRVIYPSHWMRGMRGRDLASLVASGETWVQVGMTLKLQGTQSLSSPQKYVLTYAKRIADLTDAAPDEVLPERLVPSVVYYATSLAAELSGDAPLAQSFMGRAMQEMRKLRAELAREIAERFEEIRDVEGLSDDEGQLYWT